MRAGPPGAPAGRVEVGDSREAPVEQGGLALFLSAVAPG